MSQPRRSSDGPLTVLFTQQPIIPMPYNRRSYRLRGYNYALPHPYFITICTHKRRELFGHIRKGKMHLNDVGRIVDREWINTGIQRPEAALDEYVIMPNHLHLILWILEIGNDKIAPSDEIFAHFWKNAATGRILAIPEIDPITIDYSYVRLFGKPVPCSVSSIIGAFKAAVSRQVRMNGIETGRIWQGRFYDHIIRNENALRRIRRYIRANPERWECDRERKNSQEESRE